MVRATKVLVFVAALGPCAYLGFGAWTHALGANPIETITRQSGVWTLRFVLLALAVTPVRRWTGRHELARFRRMFGLYAFFYGSLHLLTYVWLDQFFDAASILRDVSKRPFVAAGVTAYLLMLPLAATSTAGMIRRLGARRWRRLHRLAYAAAAVGVVHYWWLVKADTRSPRTYALIVGVLLATRAAAWWQTRRSGKGTPAGLGLRRG